MEADDLELLRDYAQNHSEQAFRTLVERHVNMVFAVALRQTENTQLAEEVTQAPGKTRSFCQITRSLRRLDKRRFAPPSRVTGS